MEVLLDTNFIISCVKHKIAFMEQLEEQGFKVIVPREVLDELKDLRLKVSHDDRTAITIALELLSSKKIKKRRLSGTSVDEGLILLGKQGAYIATLDNGIRRLIPNSIGIHTASNSIVVARS